MHVGNQRQSPVAWSQRQRWYKEFKKRYPQPVSGGGSPRKEENELLIISTLRNIEGGGEDLEISA